MSEFEKAKRRIERILNPVQSVVKFKTDINTLLPESVDEEPFFVIYDIDWSKYGRGNK